MDLSDIPSDDNEDVYELRNSKVPKRPQGPPLARDLFLCGICEKILFDPRTLWCGHSYCFKCIADRRCDSCTLTCPLCDVPVFVPPNTTAILDDCVKEYFRSDYETRHLEHTQKESDDNLAREMERNIRSEVFRCICVDHVIYRRSDNVQLIAEYPVESERDSSDSESASNLAPSETDDQLPAQVAQKVDDFIVKTASYKWVKRACAWIVATLLAIVLTHWTSFSEVLCETKLGEDWSILGFIVRYCMPWVLQLGIGVALSTAIY